ncbi:11641_t:CDS:1, partial [Dentiscutata heterogama]
IAKCYWATPVFEDQTSSSQLEDYIEDSRTKYLDKISICLENLIVLIEESIKEEEDYLLNQPW